MILISSAAWLDAEHMLIVNPDGKVHRHQKVDGALVELEPLHYPDIVAPVDPVETALHSIAYWIQTAAGNRQSVRRRLSEQGEADFR